MNTQIKLEDMLDTARKSQYCQCAAVIYNSVKDVNEAINIAKQIVNKIYEQ